MVAKIESAFLSVLLLAAIPALASEAQLKASVRAHSEGALLKELVAEEQAAARAKSRSEYGIELRPGASDSDAGVVLRVYLPDRWSKKKLRDQLTLVAKSEELRVAALEWRELLAVYRDFCTYRMLDKQWELYDAELKIIRPYLAKADQGVKQNQLAVIDRAKLYSFYLDLMNDQGKVEMEFIGIQQRLHLVLGSNVSLETFAETAVIALPTKLEIGEMVRQAQSNRADFQRLDVEFKSLAAAEAVARSEDGFRLKYIQPEYEMDYDSGESRWGFSASFILPWGTLNPDIAVYQKQQELALSSMILQRRLVEERLQVLVNTSNAFKGQIEQRNHLIKPLLKQLEADLAVIESGQLKEIRDRLTIRERILDASLQTAKNECARERIAVDLAEEIGTLGE